MVDEVGARNDVLDGCPDTVYVKGQTILGDGIVLCNECGISRAKTAEPIKLPFGTVSEVVP